MGGFDLTVVYCWWLDTVSCGIDVGGFGWWGLFGWVWMWFVMRVFGGLRAMICGGSILVWLVWVLFGLLCYKQHGFQVAISAL